MESVEEYWAAVASLDWQVELGAIDAVSDTPVDRYALDPAPPRAAPAATPPAAAGADTAHPAVAPPQVDPVALARAAADAAGSLEALRTAMAGFEHCELRRGARNLVFSDGTAGTPLMILGEAPGRDEDREGRPFVGRAGQLLDRMLAAIGRDRTATTDAGVYITNVLPWRPPQNREPTPDEIAMMLPFVERHIALAAPRVLICMGNIACQALLGQRGITRLRGNWSEAVGIPVMPMFHPAYLLRQPHAKREAWADLLEVRARLEATDA